jgi:hypothetical protein
MRRSTPYALLGLATCLLLPRAASAQAVQNIVLRNSFSPIGAGARGLGMGGAFIGVADDGTAASFNPAGLSQLRRSELAAVLFTSTVNTEVPNPEGAGESEGSTHRAPEFLGLALPFEVGGRNLTIQLSYQRSVDLFGKGRAFTRDTVPFSALKINLPGSARVNADVTPQQAGAFRTLALSAGYALTPRFSAGASANYWFGDWTSQGHVDYRISTVGTAPSTLVSSTNRTFLQDQSMRALSVNGGVLMRASRISLGGVLRLPFVARYELEETGTITTTLAGKPSSAPSDVENTMKSRLHWPLTWGTGLAVRPFTGLTLAADYSRSSWAGATIDDVPEGALLTQADAPVSGVDADLVFHDRNFFDLVDASQTTVSDTSEWRAGAEYLVSLAKVVVPLRAGTFRSHSPIRDLSRDEGRVTSGLTFGTGLNFSQVVVDVAFERRSTEGVVGLQLRGGAATPSGTTVEKVTENRVVASVIYRLPPNDPVKRFLRGIFVGDEPSH